MSKISIVIPLFNEENLLQELISRIFNFDFGPYEKEVILVNDGSTDQTLEKSVELKQAYNQIRIISLSRNFGHQMAITAGLENATGDAIITMDGDLQDPPELIGEFIKKWELGYQIVYGIRSKRKGESGFKHITATLFYRLLSKLSEIKIPIDTGDFKLMDKKVVDSVLAMKENNRFLRGMVSWVGFKSIGIKFEREKRHSGKSKFSFWKMFKFSLDGIISFSTKPLYISIFIGIILSMVAFFWFCYVILNYYFGFRETVSGWSSIIAAILLIGGINLMFMGIIGLYIGRIFKETQKRPLYIIDKEY